MDPEVRKNKVKKYGSFLYCPDRATLCFCCNTENGTCERGSCILDDPEYISLQRRIEENRAKNAEEEKAARAAEKKEMKKPEKSREQILKGEIAKFENFARKYYRNNNPKKGDEMIAKVIRMRGELNALERKKNGRA